MMAAYERAGKYVLVTHLLNDDLTQVDFEQIVQLVERLEEEPGPVDFKQVLHASGQGKDAADRSLRRTVAALANTDGGLVLIGVADRGNRPDASPRDRAVGIPLSSTLRKELGDKLRPITPYVRFEAGVVLHSDKQGSGILIARILLSPLRPHMFDNIFYRRTDGGAAEGMDYYQVRDQMLFTQDRLQRVRLLRLELAQMQQVAGIIASNSQPGTRPIASLHRFDVSGFKALLGDTIAVLPGHPGLLRQLLMVPVHAGELNNVLDRAQNPAWINQLLTSSLGHATGLMVMELERHLLENLRMLQEVCQTVEDELNREFGPVAVAG